MHHIRKSRPPQIPPNNPVISEYFRRTFLKFRWSGTLAPSPAAAVLVFVCVACVFDNFAVSCISSIEAKTHRDVGFEMEGHFWKVTLVFCRY